MSAADVTIIGGGIVGLATAWQLLQQRSGLDVELLEKEADVAQHQTGHNSGVIHSGIYYRPGSLRAINCRAGKALLEQFCEEERLPWDRCGKVIVATTAEEVSRLHQLLERGIANGVECRLIGAQELQEYEPHCAGREAILVPETGIVNYRAVCEKLREKILQLGGRIECSVTFLKSEREGLHQRLWTTAGERLTRTLVTCAGLHSDRVARNSGAKVRTQIVPFRGEYFELKPLATHLCRNLIYPVPDPRFPFLGVHFTRMIAGGVECGPNAVWAFAREGYRKFDVNPRDLLEAIGYRGFRKLGLKYWGMGLEEMWRSFNKRAFVRALQKLIPEIREQDLVTAPAGVRAQAISPEGELIDDFVIETSGHGLHVLNAPSPAATASLQIGKTIVEKLLPMLN